jgi:hypothetical protein
MDMPTIDHPTTRWNFSNVDVAGVTYYFSYKTCIAFNAWNGNGPILRVNEWGLTTGKHLNIVDEYGNAPRLEAPQFEAALSAAGRGGL